MSLDERSTAAATLASLFLVTPPRMRRMLDAFGGPVAALEAVRTRRVTHLIGRCEELDPRELARRWSEEASSDAACA